MSDADLKALLAAVTVAGDRQAAAVLQAAGLKPDATLLPYAIPVLQNPLAANASVAPAWSVGGGMQRFILCEIRAAALGLATFNVRSPALGRDLFQAPVLLQAVCGPSTNPRPYRLPIPVSLSGDATGSVLITDLSGAANWAGVVLCGYAVQ